MEGECRGFCGAAEFDLAVECTASSALSYDFADVICREHNFAGKHADRCGGEIAGQCVIACEWYDIE